MRSLSHLKHSRTRSLRLSILAIGLCLVSACGSEDPLQRRRRLLKQGRQLRHSRQLTRVSNLGKKNGRS